ncbi:Pleiotropic drug resistance ABC transporter protein [Mycena venus]|uniref:Pleiotropic drug resistance ABC transporter protein n=1 Tax=Mycena venus TaxID=2733690 RepID=A0A8H6XA48_9AGAR|nr:Pleiotropic drug resistance ABC transporter protein [Mycena venus]
MALFYMLGPSGVKAPTASTLSSVTVHSGVMSTRSTAKAMELFISHYCPPLNMQCATAPTPLYAPFLSSPMDEQEASPILYAAPVAPESSSQWFPNANGFGITRSQFVNVQGDMSIRGCEHPIQRRQSTGTIAVMPLDTSSQDSAGVVYTESGVYCSQMLRQGRGFPLYVPGPQRNLPAEYRRGGVAIGDVGRVTPEGIFDFFFNVYRPADHPINANEVPKDFVPLPPYAPRDVFHLDFDPGTHISTPSVHEQEPISEQFPGSEFHFNCVGPKGAVLALPHGAHLEKLENLENLRRYAAKHAESWYKYINGPERGRGLVNGDLCLVTGWEKALSWGMASFNDVQPDNEFQLSFRPTTDGDNGYRYRWRRGTPARQKHADPPLVPGTPLNQTTFIHAFTISLGEGIWGKIFRDVEIGQLVDLQRPKFGNGFVPFGSQKSSSWSFSPFGSGSQGNTATGRQHAGPVQVALCEACPIPKIMDPSKVINDHILREVPRTAVVITHDDDWCDVLRDDAEQRSVEGTSELLEKILERFEIMEDDGVSYLITKSQTTPLAIELATFILPEGCQSEMPEDILTPILDEQEVGLSLDDDAFQIIEFTSWDEHAALTNSPSSESDSLPNPSRRNSWFPFPDLPTLDEEAFPPTDWNWSGRKSPFKLLDSKPAALMSAFSTRSNSNSSAMSSGSVFSSLSASGNLEVPASAPSLGPVRTGSPREPTLEAITGSDDPSRKFPMVDGPDQHDTEATGPFVCNMCESNFVSKHDHEDHMKTHKGHPQP